VAPVAPDKNEGRSVVGRQGKLDVPGGDVEGTILPRAVTSEVEKVQGRPGRAGRGLSVRDGPQLAGAGLDGRAR
jgi:hypothetical protein